MGRRRKARPKLEAMEPRHLLSTISLNGTAHGVQMNQEIAPRPTHGGATPAIIMEKSSTSAVGTVGPLGEVRISSSIGSFKLSNSFGTLILSDELLPNTHNGNEEGNFIIFGGTGAYRGAQGSGQIALVRGGNPAQGPRGLSHITIQFRSPAV